MIFKFINVCYEINSDGRNKYRQIRILDSDDDLIRIPMFNLHNKIKILIEDALPALR